MRGKNHLQSKSNTIDFHSSLFIPTLSIYILLSTKRIHYSHIFRSRSLTLDFFYRISSKLETMTIFLMIKTAVGYAADLIKDILLAVVISLSQGGFTELIMQEEPYIRGVSAFLLLLGLGYYLNKIFENYFKKSIFSFYLLFFRSFSCSLDQLSSLGF